MSEPKEFYIGDVLSVTTGRLLSPAKYHADDRTHRMDGIYKIIGHMMGCEVWTHQLPAYAKPCKESIAWKWARTSTSTNQRDPVEHLIEMRGGSDEGIIAVTPE